MKKQLSSLDFHYLISELQQLIDSKVDKIYHNDKELIIRFYAFNRGKKTLKIVADKGMFLTEEDEEHKEPTGFCMFLRKHLDNARLLKIEQLKPERIVSFIFEKSGKKGTLFVEFFGKGNMIFCDDKNIILNALEHHKFKDRTINPKVEYKHPIMKYNIFELNKEDLIALFKNSKKDIIVTSLAVELGLGGIYSEEVCLLSGIDKNKNPKNSEEKEIETIFSNIEKITNKKIKSEVIIKNNDVIDVVPFELEFYEKNDKKKFETFSEALSFFYLQFKEVRETEFDKKLRDLQRIIEEQKSAIEELKKEEKEFREKGELIYHKYNVVKEILEELNKASKKYSWEEIKEKLKGHKIVKDVNLKDKTIVVEL